MDWILAIIVGAIIGWLASLVMHSREGLFAHILIGIIGAALGRWLFADVLGFGSAASAGSVSWSGFFWGVLGAVILIGLLRAFHLLDSGSRAGN